MADTAISLLNDALNLAVRGRRLDELQRRADYLAASADGEAWEASGKFDAYVARHNAKRDPWRHIETRSITPQLWVIDQYERDLYEWEVRARAFLTSEQGH